MKVVVAPLFSKWPAFYTPFEGMGLTVAWDERPHAAFDVSDAETIGDTLVRAAEQLGVTVAPGLEDQQSFRDLLTFYAFHRHGDRTAARTARGSTITIVREDDLAYWGQPFKDVTWGDVRRAKEAGLLGDRDLQRLYLVLTTPGGDGGFVDWSTVLAALNVSGWATALVANSEGSMQFVERVKARLGRAQRAIDRSAMDLADRGALPDDFAASLGTGPWQLDDLASLLGVSDDRAQGLLEGFGFSEADSGLWRLRGDDVAELLYDLREESEIAHTAHFGAQPDLALRDRLADYVRTGNRPEVPEHFLHRQRAEMTEDEVLAQDAQFDRELAEAVDLDEDDEEFDDIEDVPYESILLKCECGDPNCSARLGFARDGEQIRLEPEAWDDHFVANTEFVARIAVSVMGAATDEARAKLADEQL